MPLGIPLMILALLAAVGLPAWCEAEDLGQTTATAQLGASTTSPRAPGTADSAATAAPLIDERADSLLRGMSAFLAQQPRFRVQVTRSLDLVLDNGQKIQADSSAVVEVQRPDRLRVDRKGVSTDRHILYDGKTLSIARSDGLYASATAPATLDGLLDRAIERLGLVPPGADLLYTDPYQVLAAELMESSYIGQALIGGLRCHHLAFRDQSVDWQLWVEAGPRPLPCKMVVTARETEQAPQFVAYFSQWDLNPVWGADEFTFTPAPGAVRIDFANAAELTAQ